ncbi:MAG: hypothetical protein AAF567_24445 [Actinomycetota bacterium]
MSDLLGAGIQDAIADTLTDQDAIPLDFVGLVRYMRTGPDGETFRAWAMVSSDGIDPFTYMGMVQAMHTQAELTACQIVDPDDDG